MLKLLLATLIMQQTNCLATVIYHEARGEPIMGQAAVAYVVLNRTKHKRYPDSICEVVYQPHQFTNIKQAKPDKSSKAWENALEVAAFTQYGLITDETNGATMYHNPHIAPNPKWDFTKLALVGSLNNHTFYKEN